MGNKLKTKRFWLIFFGVSISFELVSGAVFGLCHNPINNSESHEDFAFLSPKVFDSNGGFLDGTSFQRDVLIDPSTGFPVGENNLGLKSYVASAIRSPIRSVRKYVDGFSDIAMAYGVGGDLVLGGNEDASMVSMASSSFIWDDENRNSITLKVGEPRVQENGDRSAWSLLLKADFKGDSSFSEALTLVPFNTMSDGIKISESVISSVLHSSLAFQNLGKTSFSAFLEIEVKSSSSAIPFYISAVEVTPGKQYSSDPLSSINWSDAIKMLKSEKPWSFSDYEDLTIRNVALTYGDFSYDDYAAVFGDENSGFQTGTFSDSEIDDFVGRGWMKYTWADSPNGGIGTFVLLDEVHCPLRSVFSETKVTETGGVKRELVGLKSPYRYYYYRGILKACVPPKFFIGSDEKGRDFFARLAQGFLTTAFFALFQALLSRLLASSVLSLLSSGGGKEWWMEPLTLYLGLYYALSIAFLFLESFAPFSVLYWFFFFWGFVRVLVQERKSSRSSFKQNELFNEVLPRKKKLSSILLFVGEETMVEVGSFFLIPFDCLSANTISLGSIIAETRVYWVSYFYLGVSPLVLGLLFVFALLLLALGFSKTESLFAKKQV